MCVVLRKQRLLLLLIGTLVTGLLYGQEDYLQKEYIDVNIGVGSHSFLYNTLNDGKTGSLNYSFDVGYSYFFQPQWGIQTGLGLQSFESASTLNTTSGFPDVDADGDKYDFRIKYGNWKEQQQLLYVTLPVKLQYMTSIGNSYELVFSTGLKFALPVIHKYTTEGGTFSTTGYYNKWNLELYDLPQHGFSTFGDKYSSNLSVRPVIFATADIGSLIAISRFVNLYVGAYVDYGLNNVLKSTDKHWSGTYNGLWSTSGISSVKPCAFGVKIGFSFNFLSIINWVKHEKWD
jgi:hypothetical protein